LTNKIAAEWVTAAFTAVIAITGIIALIYAWKQLKQFREAARVQHLVRLVEQFENPPLVNIRKSLADKRLRGTAEPPELENLLNFFETIGLLVRRGHLDASDVWSSFSYWMFNVFADFRGVIEEEQKDDPTYYSDFSELIERLRLIEKEEGGTAYPPSADDIEEFWRYESRISAGVPVRRRKPRRPANRTKSE
jgi:hypothetical protein